MLDPDRLVKLPVEPRALELLRAVTAGEGPSQCGNRRSIRLTLENDGWHGKHSALRAYEEAFDWIWTRGLVARDPSQDGPDWFFVTERGRQAASGGMADLKAAERLSVDLHPLIGDRVRAQYLLGEYEAAAFLAMRQVEIRVRDLAGADDSDIGVNLMKRAFADGGPLSEPDLDAGERQAKMALYWGAIGVFKNPSSHRQVDFDDPVLASEVVLLADLLLRLLDPREAKAA